MVDLDRVFKGLDRLDAPVSWSQVAHRQAAPPPDEPRRPRKILVAAFAFAVAIAGMSLLVGAFIIPTRRPASSSTSSSSGPTATSSTGTQVGASGLVVASSPTDVRFCGGVSTLALTQGPPNCFPQIRAVGVDLSALADRVTAQGVTWGDVYLAGTFIDGTLQVIEQGPPRPAESEPSLADPPCSPPPTGWAASLGGAPSWDAVEAYKRQFPSDVTSLAMFHPGPQTGVVTIASTDPERTTSALAAEYPDRLCVVRSRYQVSDVRDAKAAATALLTQGQQYGLFGVGLSVGTDGQPVVEVDAISDTPELRDALASYPTGLIQIVPWLEPVSSQIAGSAGGVVSGHLYAVGGPTNSQRPLSGSVMLEGDLKFTVSVGSDGSYSVAVPAGRYTLTGRSPLYNGGAGLCRATKPVTVTSGETLSADVLCQEK